MTETESIQKLENLIGYQFNDENVVEKARTRIAFLNDQQKKDEEKSMGPLATVGDAVLSCIVAYKLYNEKNRSSQKITELRSKEVRRERTKAFAEKIILEILSTGGKERNRIISGPREQKHTTQ